MGKRPGGERIGIISPLFSDPAQHGGITPVVLNLVRGMAARGVNVDLVLRRAEPRSPLTQELPNGVRTIDIPSRHRITTALDLARYLRNEKPVVLLSAGHRFNLAAAWASRLAPGTRVFLSVHNTMSEEAARRGRMHRIKRMASIGRFYRWADGIVAVSEGVAGDLLSEAKLPASKIKVIHNPIITPDLEKNAAMPLNHPWFQEGEPPVILGVGRLSRQKAFHLLIEAFSLVRENFPCRLVILGEGPERTRLEDMIRREGLADLARMPGFVRNPYQWMARASVLVLSSIYEGFGNVLVEALALGTPVVSTDCPSGPAEILANGRYGRLVPPGDPEALAEAISSVLTSPSRRRVPSEAVRPYDVEVVTDQYLEYLGLRPAEGK